MACQTGVFLGHLVVDFGNLNIKFEATNVRTELDMKVLPLKV